MIRDRRARPRRPGSRARAPGDAPRACLRLPDAYRWLAAYAQEARNAAAIDVEAPVSATWVGELEVMSSRHGMREFRGRAALQRLRPGTPGALQIATALVGEVDTPALVGQLRET